jgi:hypothetical protein
MILFTPQMLLLQIYRLRSSASDSHSTALSSSFAFCSLGSVDLDTVEKVNVQITDEEKARQQRMDARPVLETILNLHDFEVGNQ